ncbi:hypothetical protein [Spongorhabdus nitratireducens]
MNERSKDDSRRERIFCTLDRMQENNERINAQKVAEEVRMGKQTVLPYYREWQELQAVSDAEDTELSLDLIRVLKRELGREKFKQAEEQRLLNEQHAEDIAHLTDTVGKLTETREALEAELEQAREQNKSLEEQLEQLKTASLEDREQIREQQTQLQLQEQQLEQGAQQLEQAEKDKASALQELEQRLDESHQKLLNHWIQVADRERQAHQLEQKRVERHAEELQKAKVALSKQEVQQLQTAAIREQLEQQLNELTQANGQLQQQASCLHDLNIKLGQPEDIAVAIAHLQQQNHHCSELEAKLESITQERNTLKQQEVTQKQLEQKNSELEKEVVRLTAFLDGLQATR